MRPTTTMPSSVSRTPTSPGAIAVIDSIPCFAVRIKTYSGNRATTGAIGSGMREFRPGGGIIDAGFIAVLLPLIAFVALTAGNAFFVAAEFSLVTVDRASLDRLVDEGDAG